MLKPEERIELYEEALSKGQPVYLHAVGSSMKPLFPKHCTLKVESKDDYQINDIVAIKNDRQILAHRIISKINGRIITRGYNRLQNDSLTEVNQIMGIVTTIKIGKKEIGLKRIYGYFMTGRLLYFVDFLFNRFQKASSAFYMRLIKTGFKITIIVEYAIFKLLYMILK